MKLLCVLYWKFGLNWGEIIVILIFFQTIDEF